MRFMMIAKMPHDEFNDSMRDGMATQKVQEVLEAVNPEAAYFTEMDGQRAAVLIVDIKDASDIPKYAEPFFLTWTADVEFHPVMTPQDLGASGLDALGDKWLD
jgi:hypothetical protein